MQFGLYLCFLVLTNLHCFYSPPPISQILVLASYSSINYCTHSLCSIFRLCEIIHLSVKDLQDGSCHKLHAWNRALIIHPDIKPEPCVFTVTQAPGIVLNWNIPICFFLCANMSDWFKIWTGLSDSEAAAWSHTVWTIQCHVHMLGWIQPHFQLSCDDSHKNTKGFQRKAWNTIQILYLLLVCVTRWSKIFPF